ncbi:hypothetical protein N9948_01380 [bacterium]|nr:hypothetical protein [bacterium]
MPLNVGYFSIRQPRVSPINALTTLAPSSAGTFSLKDGFDVSYTGSATSCLLYVTGKEVMTLCNEDYLHPDNINIPIIGRTIEELSNEINDQTNYTSILITTDLDDLAFLEGVSSVDLTSSSQQIDYNTEKEYLIDVDTPGDLGTATIATKTEDFSYAGELSRWITDEGFIYDAKDVPTDLSGVAVVGTDGVVIDFEETVYEDTFDLSNEVIFEDVELVRALTVPVASTIFQAAPILIEGTLEVKINQSVGTENEDYLVDYGVKPEIKATTQSPYTFTASDNILEVRWNSESIQTFTLPIGTFTTDEVTEVINLTASNFTAVELKDEFGNSTLILKGDRGTQYHQLRIEQGSVNSVFGFTDFLSKKGSSVGQLRFMSFVPNEDLTPTEKTDNFITSAIFTATGNPFLGVDTENFKLLEDSVELINKEDFLVQGNGYVNLIDIIKEESLVEETLKIDTELFPPDYTISANGVILVEGVDFDINRQGGWITLTESAFPGHVFKATYTNRVIGIIDDEVILGGPAQLKSSETGAFNITSTSDTFKVHINNDSAQIFNFTLGLGLSTNEVVSTINLTATGFSASNDDEAIILKTTESGPNHTIKIGDGNANSEFGFSENQSSAGFGAEGGERALEVLSPPIDRTGFTAPIEGDTIIIKNNDVTDRYKRDTVIKLVNDYYQIENSLVEERANLISSTPAPYLILSDSNDVFKFSIDGEPEVTLTFTEGTKIGVSTIVSEINQARPSTARVILINGQEKIQLLGETLVVIGNGTANRTIGFDDGDEDSNSPDTYIKIVGLFRTTYVSPDIYTTVNEINFVEEEAVRLEVPQNSTEMKLVGDLTARYRLNTFVRLGGLYYYRVTASTFENGITTITLHNRTDLPILEDTSIGHTLLAIYEEGDVNIVTKSLPLTTEPFALRKNEILLQEDVDYSILGTGDIQLVVGLEFGDEFLFNYVGRRYIDAGTPLISNYAYFDFLREGTNLQISLEGINPDNFYINVLHGSTILARTIKELVEKTQNNINPSSSGFPTGAIPNIENDESGSSSFNWEIGNIDDKIKASQGIFDFYGERLQYFEDEKLAINGWIVGAEDGRVTAADIETSATNPAPTRLFPEPDARPIEEQSEPLRVPALDGLNQNDLGSSSLGTASSHLIVDLNNEKVNLNTEKTKLNTLKTLSTSSSSISSAGTFSFTASESLSFYMEIENPSGVIQQANVTVSFPLGWDIAPPPDIEVQVANQINSTVNGTFGAAVNPASSGVGTVSLGTSSGSMSKCILITADAPSILFGLDSEASLRSRKLLYTSGSTYSILVPGSDSVHLDIDAHEVDRATEDSLHSNQIANLNGQLIEWLPPYDDAFPKAQAERTKANTAVSESNTESTDSLAFQNSKFGTGIFNSIDSNITIDARISDIDARIVEIDRRISEVTTRVTEIDASLNTEGLYDPRYSWVILLGDKTVGYYAEKGRLIIFEDKRLREAQNNLDALSSLDNL